MVSLSVTRCNNNPLHLQLVGRRDQTKKQSKKESEYVRTREQLFIFPADSAMNVSVSRRTVTAVAHVGSVIFLHVLWFFPVSNPASIYQRPKLKGSAFPCGRAV